MMPTVDADILESFSRRSLEAYGAPPETAAAVAQSLVAADLVGHTSHGIVRVPYYADIVAEGAIDPTATPSVEFQGEFAQIVGGAAPGQLTGRKAVELLSESTAERGVGVVGIRDSGHLGRIGEWAEHITDQGFLFASWVNLQGGSQRIAPPGSADRRLGTNPITFGVPTFDTLPFDLVYDGATSQVAHGNIIEREGSGESLPDAWTITKDGGTVDSAVDFENGVGGLLPLGGRETGYKGFGLATMAELFAAIIGDGPVASEACQQWVGNGGAFIAIDPTIFTTVAAVEERVADLATHIRSAERIDDETDVLLPGEPEFRTRRRRREEGIPVAESVADDLRILADRLGIESSLPGALR